MTFRFRWRGVLIVALIFLPFLSQAPGCVMANSPKVGRVVDEVTGKGLADATVIASARFNVELPSGGSGSDMPYRVIARTDRDGNYFIPSTWSHIRFALPGMDAREAWVITVYKPGYVVARDAAHLGVFRPSGRNAYRAESTVLSPEASG